MSTASNWEGFLLAVPLGRQAATENHTVGEVWIGLTDVLLSLLCDLNSALKRNNH
jgi:hypothetical protein